MHFGAFRAQGTCLVAAFFPAEGGGRIVLSQIPGFEGPLRCGERERKRQGKERDRRGGRKTPPKLICGYGFV